MKKNYLVILFMLAFGFIGSTAYGLSGSYTIDPSGSGTNNYTSFSNAVSALISGGATGDVTFTVASGTFTENVSIGSFSGSGSYNIVFKGAGKTSTKLRATSGYVVYLRGGDKITFRDMEIEAAGATRTVYLTSSSLNCKFIKCYLENTSTSGGRYVIYATSMQGNIPFTVDSCDLRGGYYSAYLRGSSSSTSYRWQGVVFSNNTVDNFYYYGLYMYYHSGADIINNQFLGGNYQYSYQVYMYYVTSVSGDIVKFNYNVLKNNYSYGMYMSQCSGNSTSNRAEFHNNVVQGDFRGLGYRCTQFSANYWEIWHNTFATNVSTTTTSYGAYYNSGSYNDVKNNSFIGFGDAVPAYMSSSSNTCDYNNYYNWNSGAGTATVGGGKGSNSVNQNQGWASLSNLKISDACVNGTNLGLSTDINGVTRSNPPDIGAYEATATANDAGVVAITSPNSPTTSGAQTVKVLIKNYGSSSLASVTVTYQVDATTAVSQTFTLSSSLPACDTTTLTFTTGYTHTTGCKKISAWTTLPNGVSDGNSSNDKSPTIQVGLGLSGTFTVGGTSADFNTIKNALDAMACGGVSGPVLFKVSAGTHTAQVEVKAITGASATNTITFKGAGKTSTILSHKTTSSVADRATLILNNCEYVTFRDMTITNTGTNYAWAVNFFGSASNNNLINCETSVLKTSTSSNMVCIAISAHKYYYYTGGGSAEGNVIDSCDVIAGYFGITLYGNSATLLGRNTISNCNITDSYYYGIYSYWNKSVALVGNTISMRSNNLYGYAMYLYYLANNSTSASTLGSQITGNTINYFGRHAMYIYRGANPTADRGLIANNMIIGKSGYSYTSSSATSIPTGIFLYYGMYWDVYHNTVGMQAPSGSNAHAAKAYYTTNYDFQNNIFSVPANAGSSSYAMYSSSSPSTSKKCDYNAYYNGGRSNIIYSAGGRSNSSLNTYSSNGDDNSVIVKPPFISNTDFHLSDGCFEQGTALASVQEDIDGEVRSSSPHIGADEIPVQGLDAGVTAILSPLGVVSSGSQTVRVVVKNFGTTSLSSVVVKYKVGSSSAVTETISFSPSLANCASSTFNLSNSFTHTSGCDEISAWTESPNTSTDQNTGNDKSGPQSFGVPMAGSYTIGGTSPDFVDFTAAMTALKCAGINGAVVLDVRSGTYTVNEKFSNSDIPGISSTQTVTFQSDLANTSMPILQHSATSISDNYVMQFSGASYFSFDGLHIKANGSGFARCIDFTATNSYIKFSNCTIEGQEVTTTSNYYHVINDNSGSTNQTGNITFENNTILNGGMAFYIYGYSSSTPQNGWTITGNTIKNFYYYGLYVYNTKDMVINDNKISTNSASTYGYGIQLYYVSGPTRVLRNRITGMAGGAGIYQYYNYASSSSPAIIANNFIEQGRKAFSYGQALYMRYSSYQKYYFNTFVNTSTYTTSSSYPAVYMYFTTSSLYAGNEMKNNSISSQGYILYLGSSSYSAITSDYNNLYTPKTSSIIYAGGTYSSLSAYQSARSLDGNSFDTKPLFVASGQPEMLSQVLDSAGTTVTGVTDDIYKKPRRASKPSIGAVEYEILGDDCGITSIDNPIVACSSNKAIVTVKNFGSNTLKSATILWTVDGVPQTSAGFVGSLALGEGAQVNLGSFSTSGSGPFKIEAWTILPNAKPDPQISNDSASSTISLGMSGTFTVGGSSADYPTVQTAVDAVVAQGLCGPVVFKLAAGTFNEAVKIKQIVGSSTVNTVTFEPASGAVTIANAPTTFNLNYVVLFDGADNVIFKNITLKNNATVSTYSKVIELKGGNDGITIESCNILGRTDIFTTSSYAFLIYDWSGVANFTNNLTINNCLIDGGSYALYFYGDGSNRTGQSNLMFTNNTVTNFYYTGIYNYYSDSNTIDNNVFRNTTASPYSTVYGISLRYPQNTKSVSGNDVNINGTTSNYCLYYYYGDNKTGDTAQIVNNFFALNRPNATGTSYVIYMYQPKNVNFSHNNCLNTAGATLSSSGTAMYVYTSSSTYTGLSFYNNNFQSKKSGTMAVWYNISTSSTWFAQYNNYIASYVGAHAGFGYTTIAALASSTGKNVGAKNMDPMYDSNADLHINNIKLMKAGKGIGITTDIDNDSRDASTPTIGAHEIDPEIEVVKITPVTLKCGPKTTKHYVSVSVINNGDIDLVDVPMELQLNGGTIVHDTIRSTLAKGATTVFGFIDPIDLSGKQDHSIKVTAKSIEDVVRANDVKTLNVPYWPIPDAAFKHSEVCLGAATQFDGSSSYTGTTTSAYSVSYSWDFGDGNSGSGEDVSHTYAANGTYTVVLTVKSNNGCVGTVKHDVTIKDMTPGSISANQTVCKGASPLTLKSVTLAGGSTGSYTYQWQMSTNSGSSWANVSGATNTDYSPGATSVITMYRRQANSVSGCGPEYSNAVTISLFSPGVAGSIGLNQTICYNTAPGLIGELTPATGGNGFYSYQWQSSTDNVTFANISTATASNYTSGNLTQTTYFRRVDNSCNDDNTNSVTITVYNKFVAGSVTGDQTICPNDVPAKFRQTSSASGGDDSYSYQWQSSPNKAVWSDISGATATDYQAGAIGANTWFRRTDMSGSSCGTEHTQAILVEVAPLPNPSFVLAPHCFGDPMPITNSSSISSGTITSYEWDMGDGTKSSAQVPVHTYTSAGTYTVKLIATSSFGCKDSITKQIKISSIPTPSFKNFYDCAYDSMRFKNTTITTCGSITGYFWDFGDGGSSNMVNPSHKYATAGSYTVELRITVPGGFTDSSSRVVTIETPGSADFTTKDVCFGEDVQFTNSSLNAVSYSWDFGDNTASALTGPQHFYRVIGKYTVKLSVTDGNGCVSTITKQVEVKVKPFADFTTDHRCDGKEVPFVNGTLYADSYLWDFGDSKSSTVKNPDHIYPSAGNYNITLYADNLNGCKDTFYGNVDVYNNPVATFAASDGCDGHAVSFNNTSGGASTYDWAFGDMTTSTVASPSHVYASANTYSVTLIANSIHNCTDTVTQSVTVNPSPSVGFSMTTACLGDATTFTNNSTLSSGTMTYAWNFGDGNSSSSENPSHSYANAGNYTVTLSVTGSLGNCVESITKTVSVNEVPTVGFSAANVCDGSAVSFTNSSTGATTYMWNFGDGNTATSAAPSHTYASAGTYTVMLSVSNVHNCTSSTTQSITVYDGPAADFTSSTECLGDPTVFNNTSTLGGTGTMTFVWDFGDGTTSTSQTPNHTYSAAGNYLVTLTATSNNACVGTAVNNVTVHDVPVAHFTTGNVCIGTNTPFTNNSTGAVSYQWDFGDGSSSTARTPSHTYATSGTFLIKLIVTNANGCTDLYALNAVVWGKPTVGFTQTDVCVNTPMTFSNSSATGTYMWNFGDGYISSSSNPQHTYKRSGSFNVNLEVTNNFGCVSDVTKSVTVFAEPVAGFNAPDVCAGTNASFTNQSSGANAYMWDFGDSKTSTATNPTHAYTSGGNYTVTLAATNSDGCTNTVKQGVRINAKPKASFTTANTCLGQSVDFRNTSDGGSYTWDFGDGTGSRRPDVNHTYSTAGSYTVMLTVVNAFGCTSSVSKTVTISPRPVVVFGATATCSGATADFTNTSSISSGSLTYSWDFGDGSNDNSTSPTKTYAQGGNYLVTLHATSSAGCQQTAEKTVTVYDLAKADFTAESVCEGEKVVFINTSTNMTSASWDLGDGNSSSSIALSHQYATLGSFNVKLTVKNPIGCESSVVNTVRVNANPVASFTASDACEEVDIMFTNSSTGSAAYDWTFGDGTTSGASDPQHAYLQAGTKKVTLTAISPEGCTDEASQNITIYRRPIAQFEVSNTCFNDITRFKNTSLNGGSYSWDFGDGNTSTVAQPTHSYASTGTNAVSLTVSNSNCTDVMTINVDILSLPVSTFTTAIDGRDVVFTPTTTTGIAGYKWNFGDGTSGTGSSENHNYANAVVKTFTACLQTTGTNGCKSESCSDVKIDILGVSSSDLNYFEVFPNPNAGEFQIQLGNIDGDLSIEVVDLLGKTIKVVDTSVIADNYNVDLGQVAEGIYMVVVRNGTTITTKKIVVNN
jgi:PKD repeat protein